MNKQSEHPIDPSLKEFIAWHNFYNRHSKEIWVLEIILFALIFFSPLVINVFWSIIILIGLVILFIILFVWNKKKNRSNSKSEPTTQQPK